MGQAPRNSGGRLDISPVNLAERPPTRAAERRLLIQEVIRSGVAIGGIVLLVILLVVTLSRATTWDETRTLLDIFVPVISALVGAIAGFYFAERRDR